MVAQTPSLKAVIDELENRVGGLPGSRTVQVIRPIKGTTTWSQHSFRNASDIKIGGSAQDPIVSTLNQMKSEGYPVGTVLDRNYNSDHADHIHVEGSPKLAGDPEKPSTWSNKGSSQPTIPEAKENGVKPGEEGSETTFWDWITDPAGTAVDEAGSALKQLFARVGWAVLALTVGIVAIIFILNEFSESQTGSNLIELAASRGTSAVAK